MLLQCQQSFHQHSVNDRLIHDPRPRHLTALDHYAVALVDLSRAEICV
jgi:hypothetical protein